MREHTNQTKYITPQEMDQQRAYTAKIRSWNEVFFTEQGRRRRACVVTFGCQQNEADSERLSGMAAQMGYEITEQTENADLILINTCAVREHAELRALSITGQYKHLKAKNPGLIIGICGCMVSQETRRDDIKMKYPYVNFSFGTTQLYQMPQFLWSVIESGKRQFYLDEGAGSIAEEVPVLRKSDSKAWVSIMYGCNNFCSYCIVPYVRGRERSRKSSCIIEEVRQLAAEGYREITLLGQNVNSYGNDLPGEANFPQLLEMLCAVPGDFTLRFMTSHPKDASEQLLQVMAREKKIARQFHLPLQAGSNAVLAAMGRKYTREQYLSLLSKMREYMPDITVTSDIMVGFPTETEADFEQTLDALQKAQFDMIFSFIYSPRPGTPAAKLPQLPEEVKSERFSRLLQTQNEISLSKNRACIGTVQRVLVEGVSKHDKKMFSGRTDGGKLVHFPATDADIAQYRQIKITDADTFSLFGEMARREDEA